MKTKLYLTMAIVFAMLSSTFSGCQKDSDISVTGISLNTTAMSIAVDSVTEAIVVKIIPNDATEQIVTWTSSNDAIATVADGKVTGVAVGNAIITATSGGFSAVCKVEVTPKLFPVTSVEMGETAWSMPQYQNYKLYATPLPDNTTDELTLTWTSSNPDVATVDSEGNIKSLTMGTTTIAATAVNGVSGTCVITVTEYVAAVGDIYFSDLSLGHAIDPERTAIGIVYQVTPKIKVVSIEQGTAIKWSDNITKISASSNIDGTVNVAAMKVVDATLAAFPAAKWCADLGEGWYMPAFDEVALFGTKAAIGGVKEVLNDIIKKIPGAITIGGKTGMFDPAPFPEYGIWSSTEGDGFEGDIEHLNDYANARALNKYASVSAIKKSETSDGSVSVRAVKVLN